MGYAAPPMAASKVITKTDREMEDRMLSVASDPERVDALAKARAFKRTWIELADALAKVQDGNAWERWGFTSFDAYCRKELHLKPGTVQKLLGSYRFLETAAPRVIERARDEPRGAVPSLQAVDFVARAAERGAADRATMKEMQRVAFDEGADAPLLARRFKETAFPVDDDARKDRMRQQLVAAAKRLASLIAEPGVPIPKKVAVSVEESIGELLDALDAAD
jgi:hypothetical protein